MARLPPCTPPLGSEPAARCPASHLGRSNHIAVGFEPEKCTTLAYLQARQDRAAAAADDAAGRRAHGPPPVAQEDHAAAHGAAEVAAARDGQLVDHGCGGNGGRRSQTRLDFVDVLGRDTRQACEGECDSARCTNPGRTECLTGAGRHRVGEAIQREMLVCGKLRGPWQNEFSACRIAQRATPNAVNKKEEVPIWFCLCSGGVASSGMALSSNMVCASPGGETMSTSRAWCRIGNSTTTCSR